MKTQTLTYIIISILIVLIAVIVWKRRGKSSILDPILGPGKFLVDMALPRGIRNNNPGNIRINPANAWQGKVPEDQNSDGSFEQFYEKKYGVRALIKLLKNYHNQGLTNVSSIISKYAPSSENHTGIYVKYVADYMGVSPTQHISWTHNNAKKLVEAIIRFENGTQKNWISPAEFDQSWNLV